MDTDPKREKIKEDICTYLRGGMYKKDASVMAGIDESTLYRWIEADASFASRVEASILEYKQSLIQKLNVSAGKNGMLALKILELRWPKDWAVPQREGDEENSTKRIADLLQKIYDRNSKEVLPEQPDYDFS